MPAPRFVYWTKCRPLEDVPTLARHLEALGFWGLAVSDHVITAPSSDRRLQERDWADGLAVLAAVASVTTRLQLLTSVLVLPLRDTPLVAQSVATIDRLSAGRVLLGVGAGWWEPEFDLLQRPFTERGQRLELQITEMRAWWDGGAHPGRLGVRPTNPVPILVGGRVIPRIAAYGDGWIAPPHLGEDLPKMLRRIECHRAALGRASPFDVAVRLENGRDQAEAQHLAALGATILLLEPLGDVDLDLRTLEAFAAQVIRPLTADHGRALNLPS